MLIKVKLDSYDIDNISTDLSLGGQVVPSVT